MGSGPMAPHFMVTWKLLHWRFNAFSMLSFPPALVPLRNAFYGNMFNLGAVHSLLVSLVSLILCTFNSTIIGTPNNSNGQNDCMQYILTMM